MVPTSNDIDISDDEELHNNRIEELDEPPEDLPIEVNWSEDLPNNILVPKIDLHTLILDFTTVSFIDMSGMKVLKAVSTFIFYVTNKNICASVLTQLIFGPSGVILYKDQTQRKNNLIVMIKLSYTNSYWLQAGTL